MKVKELLKELVELPAECREKEVVFTSKGLGAFYPVEHVVEECYEDKEKPLNKVCITDNTMGLTINW